MMTLVIMAAGMGSRYGGLKQIDPVRRDMGNLCWTIPFTMPSKQDLTRLSLSSKEKTWMYSGRLWENVWKKSFL